MQETPAARLLPQVVERLRGGTELRQIVAAAALANARTFGGEDYVGFHTMMAIAPAFHMTAELPQARRALPVLKVLYRNASRIQAFGGPFMTFLTTIASSLVLWYGGLQVIQGTASRRQNSGAAVDLFQAQGGGASEDELVIGPAKGVVG